MPHPRPLQRALAERAGILPSYVDLRGRERETSDATREALLAAMGLSASTEDEAATRIAELDRARGERLLEPVRVVSETRRAMARLELRPPASGAVAWRAELVEEGGARHVAEGRLRADSKGKPRRLGPVAAPPPGYHRLRVEVRGAGLGLAAEQQLIVAPRRCAAPLERTGRRRAFGIVASLYALRSDRNWGVGDLTDLADLARWSGERGAAFVGVNPLHALRNRGWEVSPYGPLTRLYRNVIYLDVERVPELAGSEEVRARLAAPEVRDALASLRAGEHVAYERALALKRPLLEDLHRAFAATQRGRDTPRGRAYAAWLAREGEALEDFATFCAIEERLAAAGHPPGAWRGWPEPLRHPRSTAVAALRREHSEAVDLHRWLQFELDRQLADAAEAGRRAGLQIGVYQDLAIGTSAGGSDPWAFPGLFIEGASIGAPPDDFSAHGQDWGLPPLHPGRLREDGYRYWIRLLRAAFAHAGALRIDHVMGLWRQYWIPAGRRSDEGAYVRYPADDLAGILALESSRHGAAVVGEDLGTVPAGLREELARRGILSSRVLIFERDAEGFHPASSYPRAALVTANTHDLPPLVGFWEGRDLDLRRQVGHLADDGALERARSERDEQRRALIRRLQADGALGGPPENRGTGRASAPDAPGAEPPAALDHATLCEAVHAFLGRTPSELAGAALDDLAGESAPVNLPGVPLERYPSWSRRLHLSLEKIAAAEPARRALAALRAERGTRARS